MKTVNIWTPKIKYLAVHYRNILLYSIASFEVNALHLFCPFSFC